MVEYLTILAWLFGIPATLMALGRMIVYLAYRADEIWQLRDLVRGQKRSFPVTIPASISVICWVWIYVNW